MRWWAMPRKTMERVPFMRAEIFTDDFKEVARFVKACSAGQTCLDRVQEESTPPRPCRRENNACSEGRKV